MSEMGGSDVAVEASIVSDKISIQANMGLMNLQVSNTNQYIRPVYACLDMAFSPLISEVRLSASSWLSLLARRINHAFNISIFLSSIYL